MKSLNKLRVMVYKEGGIFYASAIHLNITSSGDDKFLAMINLEEAVRGYLEIAQKEGILSNVWK